MCCCFEISKDFEIPCFQFSGKKNEENCKKAPKTCALVEQFPEASTCTRGQVRTCLWYHLGADKDGAELM